MCSRFRTLLIAFCLLSIAVGPLNAQNKPVGQWRSHLPYNHVFGLATDGNTIYAISDQSFFTYNYVNGELTPYSKLDGMADVGMSQVGYDLTTNTAIICYANSDIDLFKDNSFHNMPDVRKAPFTGTKAINAVYTDKGFAYLSTALGIVVVDLERREVKETYVFSKNGENIPINSFASDEMYFYAATGRGLYRAKRNGVNLQAFASWSAIDTVNNYKGLAVVNERVFASGIDSLFTVNGNAIQFLRTTDSSLIHIDAGKGVLNMSMFKDGQGWIRSMDLNFNIVDSFKFGYPRQSLELGDGTLFVADQYGGLSFMENGQVQRRIPLGPVDYSTFDILPVNGEVWLAHGGYRDNWGPTFNLFGLSHFINDSWTNYSTYTTSSMNFMYDVMHVSKDPAGNVYGGSLAEGVIVLKPNGNGGYTDYRLTGDTLEAKINEPNVIPATSSATDQLGNLWITQSNAAHELAVRTPNGTWYHYTTPVSFTGGFVKGAAGLVIDDNNQKWFFGPQGRGVIVYNDNNTPESGADDTYYQFTRGKGAGNLPSNLIYCLAKDRDNAIWVGTDAGIAIINCGGSATTSQCDAELRVVQYDDFAGLLFSEEQVKSIAVDGGNRKWIGTNNGVWLISPDANKVLLRFTKENSPLPSNIIQKIAVDPVTGDVYIGTDQGMVSYRGTATEGGSVNSNVLTFPNPVPSGYTGTIAIRGLTTDADVRITDISGHLVYRTKAAGGQATWSGQDYTGHRPATGVYLIFVTNKDGSQTHTGKIMFNH